LKKLTILKILIVSNLSARALWRFRLGYSSFLKLWLASLFCGLCGLVQAEVLVGQVVGVSDGDTLTLLDANRTQHKIRLAGIDAPEKAQAFGQASKKSLSDLVYRKQVTVYWDKTDRYQRTLGKVTLNEQDICLEQVKRGMAWHYKQYQRDQSPEDRLKYDQAEKEARHNRIGLWADESPVEPSTFRHSK
jgi:endonuclease YncB( thermonuclease family)